MRHGRLVVMTAVLLCILCGTASAGEIRCRVTRGGVPEAGVSVVVTPGGASAITDAAGQCRLSGLAAGKYRVTAEKTIGGALYGAIADPVVVAEGGSVSSVSLALVQAIHISQYMPLTVGSFWQYRALVDSASRTVRERATGTAVMFGDAVTVLEVNWSGSADTEKRFWRSSSAGFAVYGEMIRGDTITFEPPLRLPNMLPLGHAENLSCIVKHSDGSPDQAMLLSCRFSAFERVTVPAGTFADCPRFDMTQTVGGETMQQTMWFARGVGQVRIEERKPTKTVKRELEEYHITRLRPPGGLPGRPVPAP